MKPSDLVAACLEFCAQDLTDGFGNDRLAEVLAGPAYDESLTSQVAKDLRDLAKQVRSGTTLQTKTVLAGIDRLDYSGMNPGLIAANLMQVGGQTHLELGYLPNAAVLIQTIQELRLSPKRTQSQGQLTALDADQPDAPQIERQPDRQVAPDSLGMRPRLNSKIVIQVEADSKADTKQVAKSLRTFLAGHVAARESLENYSGNPSIEILHDEDVFDEEE